jgi:hypothetical protein
MLDPTYWRSVARNPAAVIGLLVDLAPIVAVIFWGWGAGALVLLYWLENVVIGLAVVPRILLAAFGKHGRIGGFFSAAFNVPFFIFHYGLFCFVHGTMLLTFLHNDASWSSGPDMVEMATRLIGGSLAYARHMDWILAGVAAFHALVLVRDYILNGEWKQTTPEQEVANPYGRVILLHIGVFVIGGALMALGDPMIGVLALVIMRALWGLQMNMRPRQTAPPAPVPV